MDEGSAESAVALVDVPGDMKLTDTPNKVQHPVWKTETGASLVSFRKVHSPRAKDIVQSGE